MLYIVLVIASLGVIIPIGVAALSIRAFAALAGTDVDISSLMKIS